MASSKKLTNLRWDFFIAHSAADVDAAKELHRLLKSEETFLASECLVPGDDWDRALPDAQRKSLLTVVLISSNTKSSYYQREEIAAAIAMARENKTAHRVIPVFLEGPVKSTRLPYGLRLKHGLILDSQGLRGIARKLKRTLAHVTNPPTPTRQAKKPRKTQKARAKITLADAICALSYDELIDEVITPLVEVLHPGGVEYSSISPELGRSVVSLGQDHLRRPHIVCIQPIAGASFPSDQIWNLVCQQAKKVKDDGITRPNGMSCNIDEVWIVSTHQLDIHSHAKRSEMLRRLSRMGIKCIWGDEVCALLIENLPEKASELSKFATPEVINLLSALSKHSEGRAFGFSKDRNITEFYVTAALSPYATHAYAAARGELYIGDFRKRVQLPVNKLIRVSELYQSDEDVNRIIKDRILEYVTKGALADFDVDISVVINDEIKAIRQNYLAASFFRPTDFLDVNEFLLHRKKPWKLSDRIYQSLSAQTRRVIAVEADQKSLQKLAEELNSFIREPFYSSELFAFVPMSKDAQLMIARNCSGDELVILNRILLEDAFPTELARNSYAKNAVLKVDLTFHLKPVFSRLVEQTKSAINDCPNELRADVNTAKRSWEAVERTETFVKVVSDELKISIPQLPTQNENYVEDPVRIRVPHPEFLLKLNKLVLIEGPPGCGKTTLLKILAINLLTRADKVLYLPCSTIRSEYRKAPLKEIGAKFGLGSVGETAKEKPTLILDGLDEAAFDLSNHVLSGYSNFSSVIISTRNTYKTAIRDEAFRVALSPFDDEEREQFFEGWFRHSPELVGQARDLISKYPDINSHTRLPLIATITVALLQNGMVPRTRAEIYAFRLELLLSKWDRFRGVDRLYVDNPDAKRRFLRELAYAMHSSVDKRRSVDLEELRDVYEHSLGEWGYNISYEKVLKDLILGSGILIEERIGVYSFGHLTFQEHLAAEYVAETFSTAKVSHFLGNDWWREPLNFYASIKGNVTDLIDYMMGTLSYMVHAQQLAEMATYAPYTSPGAIQCIEDSLIAGR